MGQTSSNTNTIPSVPEMDDDDNDNELTLGELAQAEELTAHTRESNEQQRRSRRAAARNRRAEEDANRRTDETEGRGLLAHTAAAAASSSSGAAFAFRTPAGRVEGAQQSSLGGPTPGTFDSVGGVAALQYDDTPGQDGESSPPLRELAAGDPAEESPSPRSSHQQSSQQPAAPRVPEKLLSFEQELFHAVQDSPEALNRLFETPSREDVLSAVKRFDDDKARRLFKRLLDILKECGSIDDGGATPATPEAILFLRACALLTGAYLDGLASRNTRSTADEAFEVAKLLHDELFPLHELATEENEEAKNTMWEICNVCEQWWIHDFDGKDLLVSRLVPVLLVRSMGDNPERNAVERLYSIRTAVDLVDFDDEDFVSIKKKLLETVGSPLFLRMREGKKFIQHLFSFDSGFAEELHKAMKEKLVCAEERDRGVIADIYYGALKSAIGKSRDGSQSGIESSDDEEDDSDDESPSLPVAPQVGVPAVPAPFDEREIDYTNPIPIGAIKLLRDDDDEDEDTEDIMYTIERSVFVKRCYKDNTALVQYVFPSGTWHSRTVQQEKLDDLGESLELPPHLDDDGNEIKGAAIPAWHEDPRSRRTSRRKAAEDTLNPPNPHRWDLPPDAYVTRERSERFSTVLSEVSAHSKSKYDGFDLRSHQNEVLDPPSDDVGNGFLLEDERVREPGAPQQAPGPRLPLEISSNININGHDYNRRSKTRCFCKWNRARRKNRCPGVAQVINGQCVITSSHSNSCILASLKEGKVVVTPEEIVATDVELLQCGRCIHVPRWVSLFANSYLFSLDINAPSDLE